MCKEIHVCHGRWCHELGAESVSKKIEETTDLTVTPCKCLGYCERGVVALKQGKIYTDLSTENIPEALEHSQDVSVTEAEVFEDDFLGDL